MTQFKIWKSTWLRQSQGLIIFANVREPKVTIGAIMILEVFDGPPFIRIQVNIKLVIKSLARILDNQTKVRDVVILGISTILNYIRPLDWTDDRCPIRRRFCLSAANELWRRVFF